MDRFSNAKPLLPVFPFNMMNYIIKNPPRTAFIQWKLIKVCKIFFAKHPYIPISDIFLIASKNEIKICNIDNCNYKHPIPLTFHGFKLWITDHIIFQDIYDENRHALSELVPQIYQCDCQALYLDNQNLNIDEWKFLASSKNIKSADLLYVRITDKENKILVVEDILVYFSDGPLGEFRL